MCTYSSVVMVKLIVVIGSLAQSHGCMVHSQMSHNVVHSIKHKHMQIGLVLGAQHYEDICHIFDIYCVLLVVIHKWKQYYKF